MSEGLEQAATQETFETEALLTLRSRLEASKYLSPDDKNRRLDVVSSVAGAIDPETGTARLRTPISTASILEAVAPGIESLDSLKLKLRDSGGQAPAQEGLYGWSGEAHWDFDPRTPESFDKRSVVGFTVQTDPGTNMVVRYDQSRPHLAHPDDRGIFIDTGAVVSTVHFEPATKPEAASTPPQPTS